MAIVLKDRVKETAAAPGTGTITLSGAVSGFQAFSAIGNANVTYFAIVDNISGAWEVNYGTYTLSGTTLTRNATPLSSSAAGALVNFTGVVDVFCTYPSEKAIYEETSGNVLIDGGPITVVGSGVTTYSTFAAALGEMYANINGFAQFYAQNLNDGSSASTDIVAYNDAGDGSTNFIDMGISSSNYSDATYPIFTAGSGYVYNDGGEMIIGSATDDVLFFAGGVATTDWAARINKTTKSLTTKADLNVGADLDVTGNTVFGGTVLLDANPTIALQAATKAYVDEQVTAGLHIHEPVRVETTGNLTATYVQGGTTFNITDITSTTTVTTSTSHGLSVNDQIWLYSTAGNGLSTNTAYFVFSVPAANQLTLSLTFDGTQITGLTNASGLTYATRANSGVGATLTNSGAQAALQVDGVNLSTTNRVMVRLQTNGAENGVYVVTTVGSGSTNWVLTRATDASFVSPSDPDGLGTGDYFFTQEGTLNAGDSHVLTTEPNTMIIGYTPLTYTQFSGSVDYTGGTNISVVGQTISVTGTIAATLGGTGTSTVATGDTLYGSGTNTWSKLSIGAAYKSLVVNGAGTLPEWNAVALNQSGAVSGALPATNGGTGINSYTLGDTLYSSAANTIAALPGNTTTTKKFLVQTGTGSASAAPVWGTVSGSDVSGNISGSAGSVANALTFGTYLTGGTYNGSAAVTATVDATSANTASKVVARDSSGNFSAGTITATLNGTATSTASATNLSGGAANQIAYQSATNTTAFATAPSASNQVLNWNGSAFTWSTGTISGVPLGSNLNSLTAGTYLTGTAYNGSAAQTWTVDATSANTASKVVARDGSGNFSAGTITAALVGNVTGNASTATTASDSNLLGGKPAQDSTGANTIPTRTGDGYTYLYYINSNTANNENPTISQFIVTNGGDNFYRKASSASVISQLGLLTTSNYNSYAPTLTGTGASGTWNINVTGSAGSAPGYLPLSGGTMTGTIVGGSGVTSLFTGNYAGALRGYLYNDTSGFGLLTYNGNWAVRVDYGTNSVYIPGIGYSASSLRAPIFYDSDNTGYYLDPASSSVLNTIYQAGVYTRNAAGAGYLSGNYSSSETSSTTGAIYTIGGSYVPTSTSFGTMYGIGYCYAAGISVGISGASGWGLYVNGSGINNVWLGGETGQVISTSEHRATIYYDYSDTGYYIDPASTSNSALRMRGGALFGPNVSWGQYLAVGGNGNISTSYASIATTDGNLHMDAKAGSEMYLNYYAGNAVRAYGTFYANNLYDLNDTAYYLNPNGSSYLYSLQLSGAAYFRPNSWIQFDGDYGIYSTAYNGAHFLANASSSYGTWRMIGSRGGYGGIYDTYSGVTTGMFDGAGNGGFYREANGRWYQFYNISNDCTGFGASTTASGYNIYCGTGIYSGGRVDGTIFYDSNNTGYYLDLNGSSNASTNLYGSWYFISNRNTTSDSPPLQAYSSGGSGAIMAFHRGGQYAINMGLDSDNVFRIGGWSAAANRLQMDMSGNLTMAGNVTAYSDETLKKDWADLPSDFVPRLARVKSGTYTRIDNEMRQIGVGAQSLRPLMEEAVFENADGTLSVAYGNAAMASSVELARYVTALEQRISQLEARI